MKDRELLFTDLKSGTITCFKISMVFAVIFTAFLGDDLNVRNVLVTFFVSCLYSFGIGMGNGFLNVLLDKKWDWKEHTNTRVYYGILVTVLYTVPVVLAINYFIFVVLQNQSLDVFFGPRMIWVHLFYIILSLGVSTFMQARSFMIKWKQASKFELTQQKIIAGTANAQFESLKNQIDPHFLFNSLNVLSSLIEENPDNAQRFTTSLSKIYRYVLEQKDKELVSVEDELSFAKTYMNLLKMRFENSLFYELPTSISNPEAKVVPLSLQLLLENTVKHNVVSEQHPLHIRIFEENDYLVIQNDLRKKEVIQDRRGVGLQNIINRYAIITGRKVIIEQTDTVFAVKIPILTKQISVMEPEDFNHQSSYHQAQKRVEAIKGFYGNLTSYLVIMAALAILNLVTTPQYLWFLYPAGGWGIGVLFHGLQVFNFVLFLGRDWEEKKINELINQYKTKKWK